MDILKKYFPGLDTLQMEQLVHFSDLISLWNQRINLISRKDIPYLAERHILHSLSISLLYSFPESSRILDVGTGGGFPGIPLAILCPNVSFTLVDSIGKKVDAVREMCKSLQLSNVEVMQVRAELLDAEYHYIVSRAVAHIDKFTLWVKGKIIKPSPQFPENGILYLKGGELSEEMQSFPLARIHDLSVYFNEPFFETKRLIYLPFEGLS